MKPRQFINPYRWYDDYARSARTRGDGASQHLGEFYYKVGRSNNNDQIKIYCDEAVKLAKALDEPYWELYFRIIAYDFSPDNGYLTDNLIQMSIDVNQPRFEGCPINGRVYQALLNAYSAIDPLGHATDIIEGADYVEQYVPLDEETYLALAMFRLRVYVAQRNWSQAYYEGTEYHNRALEAVNSYHSIRSSIRLAEVLYFMGNYYTALDTLSQCSLALEKRRDPSWDKTVLLWYLMLYKRVDDEKNYDIVHDKLKQMPQIESYDYLSGRAKLELSYLQDRKIGLLSDLLIMGDVFNYDKYRDFRISLSLEYLAELGKTPIWQRTLHFGTHNRLLARIIPQFADLPRIIILTQVFMIINIGIAIIVGTFIEASGYVKRKIVGEIRTASNKSPAKAIYEDRLLRIEAGDYTRLS